MNGGTLVRRGLMVAAVLGGSIGALVGAPGTAQANDRTTATVCSDARTGAWEASMTFSSIDVRADHPVVLSFGSASTTLTEPGPDGTATLTQHFSPNAKVEQVSWSVVRNDAEEHSGVVVFERPDDCKPPTPTTAPPTVPPTTTAPTSTPTTAAPTSAPTTSPRVAPASSGAPLPVTGGHPSPVVWIGLLALAVGTLATWWSRRRPEDLSRP
jgi:hypothetical protein